MSDDHFHEACGVFGIYGAPEAANLTYLGLYALQHRGQESAGIVASDGTRLRGEIGMGLVADVFTEENLRLLPGYLAIGHNRYSTTGQSELANAQPLLMSYAHGSLALAHNGNLVNAQRWRETFEQRGAIFRTTTDTEVIMHLIASEPEGGLVASVSRALTRMEGAYSLLLMDERSLLAIRDPYGFRPLCLGQRNGAWVVASESCALDLIEADFEREIKPGEILHIGEHGLSSHFPFLESRTAHCVFEHVYFARPDSMVFGRSVYQVRLRLGRQLAREAPVEADLVIPVPDSGVPAALGYAQEMRLPFDLGLIRNHYVGRTFIEPRQQIRHFGVKVKLNANRALLDGKRVVVVDDSIIRGTTSRKIVTMLRHAGAKEVHLRISAPPTIAPCYYGVDTPTYEELIATQLDLEAIRSSITADSLAYLSLEGMMAAVEGTTEQFCAACFTNRYPVSAAHPKESQLQLFQVRPGPQG